MMINHHKISTKTSILAFGISLISSITFMLFFLINNFQALEKEYNSTINTISNSYVDSLTLSAWNYDQQQINETARGIKRLAYVLDVGIQIPPHVTIAPKITESRDIEEKVITLIHHGEVLGQLTIYMNKGIIFDKVVTIAYKGIAFAILLSLIIWFSIRWTIRRYVTQRIEELASQIIQHKNDHQVTPFKLSNPENAPLELINIFNELNQLMSSIHVEREKSDTYKKQLELEANYDPLTKLPNRNNAVNKIKSIIAHTSLNQFAAIFINFGTFRSVNESFGREVGDRFLFHVSRKIQQTFPELFCARVSKDHFLVIMPYAQQQELINNIEGLVSKLSNPIEIFGAHTPIKLKVYVGVSLYPDTTTDTEGIFIQGEIALRLAKKDNYLVVYNNSMDADFQYDNKIRLYLPIAIRDHEFTLNYQPIVDAKTHQIVSVECLIRWNNGQIGYVRPDIFIAIAEEEGLIIEIETFVFNQAFADLEKLQALLNPDLVMAINVSYLHFKSSHFIPFIQSLVKLYHINPRHIKLEITERIFLQEDAHVIDKMNALIAMGMEIAIDDFGTGYSAISYVKSFPFSTLKIDKSFITAMLESERDLLLIKNIIHLSHDLGLNVVAEGVELAEQASTLADIGCDMIQGFYFARPNTLQHFISINESALL